MNELEQQNLKKISETLSFMLARRMFQRRAAHMSSTTSKGKVVAIVCDSAANCRTALTHCLQQQQSENDRVDVNALTINGKSALRTMIALSDEDSVRMLLTHRVSPALPTDRGAEWPILAASRLGLVNVVKMLIDAGANVNTRTDDGPNAITPLTNAVSADHIAVVEALLDAGAHIAPPELHKYPPVLCAISLDRPAILRLLLQRGGDPRTRSSAGPSALMLAAASKSTEMIKMLLEFGLNDDDLRIDLCNAAHENSLTVVHGLLAVGADPNARDVNNVPLLLWAVAMEKWELAKALVAAKADVNCSAQGTAPLLICASRGFTEFASVLLAANADVEVLESNGATPLVRAAQFGHASIVRTLIAAGANVNHKEHDGATALVLASQNGHLEIVQALLAASADPNVCAPEIGTTALLLSAQNGHLQVVRALLDGGAVTRAALPGAHTALHMAALNGHVSVIRALLAAGADVSEANEGGLMALGLAAGNGHIDAIDELLRGGADINQRTTDGVTPLIMATHFGQARAALALVEAGADTRAQMVTGRTAHDVALERGHAEVALILKDK